MLDEQAGGAAACLAAATAAPVILAATAGAGARAADRRLLMASLLPVRGRGREGSSLGASGAEPMAGEMEAGVCGSALLEAAYGSEENYGWRLKAFGARGCRLVAAAMWPKRKHQVYMRARMCVYADQTRKVRECSINSTCHRSHQAHTCAYMHAYIRVHTCLRTHACTNLPVRLLCLCTSLSRMLHVVLCQRAPKLCGAHAARAQAAQAAEAARLQLCFGRPARALLLHQAPRRRRARHDAMSQKNGKAAWQRRRQAGCWGGEGLCGLEGGMEEPGRFGQKVGQRRRNKAGRHPRAKHGVRGRERGVQEGQ